MAKFNPHVRGRFIWVDTLKGVGIALVVYGHVVNSNGNLASEFVYMFHMPLFFAISGFLHKVQPDLPAFLRKKTIHLIVPYVSFAAISSCVFLLQHRHDLPRVFTSAQLQHDLYVLLWGGQAMENLYGVLWFLTCLFLTQQLMNWLLVRFKLRTVVIVTFAGLLLSYANYLWMPGFSLPWNAQVVPAAMPFFLAGYLCRDRDLTSSVTLFLGLFGFAGSLLLLYRDPAANYNMRIGHYGIPFVTTALALCCILGCVRVSMWLTSTPGLGSLVQRWGILSMGIMLVHKELPGMPGYKYVVARGDLFTFFVLLLISWGIAEGLSRYPISRAFLLGSDKDFKNLVAPAHHLNRAQAS